jgi:hypothetical protein
VLGIYTRDLFPNLGQHVGVIDIPKVQQNGQRSIRGTGYGGGKEKSGILHNVVGIDRLLFG